MENLDVSAGRSVRHALLYRDGANAFLVLSSYRLMEFMLVTLGARNGGILG